MNPLFLATILLLHIMWWSSGVAAQSPGSSTTTPAPDPDIECSNPLLSLINCEPFLAGGNVSTPGESCCAGLNDLVRAAPTCLCGVIAGNPSFSSINLTRAMQLPVKCGVPIDRGQCAALAAPPPNPLINRPSTDPDIADPNGSASSKLYRPGWLRLYWAALLGVFILLILL